MSPSAKGEGQGGKALSIDDVSKMTTYDLRQEVERRGLLGELSTVKHNTLLQKLVQAIVQEEYERGNSDGRQSAANSSGTAEEPSSLQDRLKQQKEQRKQEALRRSQERQADPKYFAAKQEANARSHGQGGEEVGGGGGGNEESSGPPVDAEEEEQGCTRSRVNPQGFKIFVR